LFFMWGLITSLNDILIPHLKAAFTLATPGHDSARVRRVLRDVDAFGLLVERIGHKRGIIVGCPSRRSAASRFILLRRPPLCAVPRRAVRARVGNHAVAGGGDRVSRPRPARRRRLTLTQAFNSLATIVYVGATLILGACAERAWRGRAGGRASCRRRTSRWRPRCSSSRCCSPCYARLPSAQASPASLRRTARETPVWSHRHLVLGVVAIFVYVGRCVQPAQNF
jgi:FHS family L-fucose permease-like MFS transporter